MRITEILKTQSPKVSQFTSPIFCSVFTLFFLFASSELVNGQFLKPKINNFSPEQYEAHTQIFCSAKDSNGVLYFGTNKYVLQYNGSEWKKIFVKEGFSVFAMDIDEKGRIWVGGNGDFGYLTPYNNMPKNKTKDSSDLQNPPLPFTGQQPGELHFVSLADQLSDSLRDFNIIWEIHAVHDKVIFNTNDKHLYVASKGSLETITAQNTFFSSEIVRSEAIGANRPGKELWILNRGEGILRCKIGDNKIDRSSFKLLPGSDFFNDKLLVGIIPWNDHEVIFCTGKNGLYRYRFDQKPNDSGSDTGQKRITRFAGSLSDKFKKAKVYGANRLNPQNNAYDAALAVYTNRNGLWLLKSNGQKALHVNREKGLSNNYVWDCFKDNGGQLWACTDNGISQLAIANSFTIAEEGEAFSGVLTDISYYSDQKESLFISTMQGVYEVNPGSNNTTTQFEVVPGTKGQNLALQNTRQNLLLGRGHDGLYQIDRTKKGWETEKLAQAHTFTIASAPRKVTDSFTSQPIAAIGGLNGIVVLQANEDSWKKQLTIEDLPKGSRSLAFSPKAYQDSLILWASYTKKGLLRIAVDKDIVRKGSPEAPEEDKPQPYNKSYYDTSAGLPKGLIRAFPFQNHVVFGSDSGLYQAKVNQAEGSPIRFVPDSALGPLFTPTAANGEGQKLRMLVPGANGNVWVNNGQPYHLIRQNNGYRADSLSFKSMDIGTIRAICPGAEQNVTWIGGDNGLIKYNGKEQKDFLRDYPCVISKVTLPGAKASGGDSTLLHGKFYTHDSTANPPWRVIQSQPDGMIPALPTDINRLRFHFSAPYFAKQEAIQYSYKLVGFDDEWSRWSKATKRDYTNLPAGQYTFKVKAKNVYEHESDVASYRLEVLAPFHRTAWFYGIQVGVLFLLGAFSVYFARTRKGRSAKFAISLGTVVIFLVFEYCQNYVEVYLQDYLGGIVVLKVILNIIVITLLIPFKVIMERLLLVRENNEQEETR